MEGSRARESGVRGESRKGEAGNCQGLEAGRFTGQLITGARARHARLPRTLKQVGSFP